MKDKTVFRCFKCEVWFYKAAKCPSCNSLDIGLSKEITARIKAKSAQQNVHLTAFGAGGRSAIPLQLSLFADVQSATIGGR